MNINISQASKILGVSRPTIYAMQDRGDLPKQITVENIMQYVHLREVEAKGIMVRLGEHLQRQGA